VLGYVLAHHGGTLIGDVVHMGDRFCFYNWADMIVLILHISLKIVNVLPCVMHVLEAQFNTPPDRAVL
jgi:hypothetical protein